MNFRTIALAALLQMVSLGLCYEVGFPTLVPPKEEQMFSSATWLPDAYEIFMTSRTNALLVPWGTLEPQQIRYFLKNGQVGYSIPDDTSSDAEMWCRGSLILTNSVGLTWQLLSPTNLLLISSKREFCILSVRKPIRPLTVRILKPRQLPDMRAADFFAFALAPRIEKSSSQLDPLIDAVLGGLAPTCRLNFPEFIQAVNRGTLCGRPIAERLGGIRFVGNLYFRNRSSWGMWTVGLQGIFVADQTGGGKFIARE